MNRLKLVFPNKELKSDAIGFKQEFFSHGETVINGSALWDKTESYDEWIRNVQDRTDEEKVQSGWVIATTFFAVRITDERIVGIIDIRHNINNDFLSTYGGHIGYSVCPSERRKGYAAEMLDLALEFCRDIGLSKVMLGCYKDNIASVKTIEKCGGVLEKEINYIDGKPMLVYWIELFTKIAELVPHLLKDCEKSQ